MDAVVVTPENIRDKFKTSRDYLAHVLEVLRAEDDYDIIRRRLLISLGKARRWKHAQKNGENLKARIRSHYHNTLRHPRACQKQMETDDRRLEREKWSYALLEALRSDKKLVDVAAEFGISERLSENWRKKLHSGEDVLPRIKGYHRQYINSRSNEPPRGDVLNGLRCAMCGVLFRKAHGTPVVCADCARRPDYKGIISIGEKESLPCVPAWIKEVEA